MNSKTDGVSSSSNQMTNIWNKIWNLKIPIKIKHFLWKVTNDTLPTKVNLINTGIFISSSCSYCSNFHEFTDHILFSCQRAREI